MNASLSVDAFLLAGAALLAAGVVIAGVAQRFRAPALLLFLALGMAIGDDGLGWVSFDDPARAQAIAVVALVVILFEGGLSTNVRDLRAVALPAGLLATLGVVITALVVAGSLLLLTDVDTTTCLLIGAVVASTDAAAVFSVLRTTRLPRRLSTLLEAESGANDPVAVLLTVGLLVAWQSDPTALDWVAFGVRQLAGGFAVGVAVGGLATLVIRGERFGSRTLYPVFALAAAGLAYGVGTALGASGFLAVYVAGVSIRAGNIRHRGPIVRFHQGLADAAQITLFLMLGILVFPSDLPEVAATGLVAGVALLFVARPLAVALCLPWFGVRPAGLVVATWAGLRGAVPIVLATFPLTDGYPDGSLIFDAVFFVVLLSATLQGLTLGPLVRRLDLGPVERAPVDVVADIVDVAGVDVIELEISVGHDVVGSRLRDRPMPAGARVAATIRGSAIEVPDGDSRILADDLLIVVVPRGDDEVAARLEAWVAGDE